CFCELGNLCLRSGKHASQFEWTVFLPLQIWLAFFWQFRAFRFPHSCAHRFLFLLLGWAFFAALSSASGSPNRTVILAPRRTLAPLAGAASTARPVPTSTGSRPSRRLISVTSRIVLPRKSGTATSPPSSSATVTAGCGFSFFFSPLSAGGA